METQFRLHVLPTPTLIGTPRATDGVGRALRAAFPPNPENTADFADLLGKIDSTPMTADDSEFPPRP